MQGIDVQISITEEANRIKAALTEWAEARGGTVSIMANMRHMWEQLFLPNNTTPRILICYTGETSRVRQDDEGLHRVDRQWSVAVVRGHGFKNLVAESDTDPRTGAAIEDFCTSVETIRDLVRVRLDISAEFPVAYKGIKSLPNPGFSQSANAFLDAFVLDFTTANDIPGVVLAQS